jgi:predicted HicB family RNase H-like nuclease
MAKKDDLTKSMRTGLDALLSSTEKKNVPVTNDTEKDVRCNFIMSKKYHTRLKMLAVQKGTSLKAVVEEAFELYFKTIDNV